MNNDHLSPHVVSGLQRSICNELFKATSQITESLSAAITMISDPPAPHMLNDPPALHMLSEIRIYSWGFRFTEKSL